MVANIVFIHHIFLVFQSKKGDRTYFRHTLENSIDIQVICKNDGFNSGLKKKKNQFSTDTWQSLSIYLAHAMTELTWSLSIFTGFCCNQFFHSSWYEAVFHIWIERVLITQGCFNFFWARPFLPLTTPHQWGALERTGSSGRDHWHQLTKVLFQPSCHHAQHIKMGFYMFKATRIFFWNLPFQFSPWSHQRGNEQVAAWCVFASLG